MLEAADVYLNTMIILTIYPFPELHRLLAYMIEASKRERDGEREIKRRNMNET